MRMLKKVIVLCGISISAAIPLFGATNVLPVTANLLLRLDGSDVTESGGLVSSWNNQATGTVVSADFTQSTGSAKPTLVANAIAGHTALRFDGADDYLDNLSDSAWNWDYDSDPNNAARWTTFVVFNADVKNGNQQLIRTGYNDIQEGSGTRNGDTIWGDFLRGDDYEAHARNSGGSYVGDNWANKVETNEWHVLASRFQNVVDPSIALFVDGVLRASTTTDITRQMNGHRKSRIGRNPAGNAEAFDGMIAEILVYKGALSDEEIYQVNRYLQIKYTPTTTLNDGLVLHCPMDNKYVNRDGVKPPPALTTDDGDWTVVNWVNTATNGTAKSDSTSGTVTSSEPGVINEAILFSTGTGGNRQVNFGSANDFEAGYGSLSVSLWVKPTALGGTQVIAGHGNGGSANTGWQIFSAGNNINFRCCSYASDAGKAQLSYTAADNNWYNFVMVLDRYGNKMHVYVNGSTNGVYKSSSAWGDTFSDNSISTSDPLCLGIRNNGDYEYKGAIDDFAIWKRALTEEEAAEIYAKGLQGETFVELPPPEGTLVLIK